MAREILEFLGQRWGEKEFQREEEEEEEEEEEIEKNR